MTIQDFAIRARLSRARIYQLIEKGVIQVSTKNIEVTDISYDELDRFKSLERSVGRPKKTR